MSLMLIETQRQTEGWKSLIVKTRRRLQVCLEGGLLAWGTYLRLSRSRVLYGIGFSLVGPKLEAGAKIRDAVS